MSAVSTTVSTRLVLELAQEQGFDTAGIAPLRPPRGAARFQEWLAAGHQADMTWLETNLERILDPRLAMPEGKSLLVVGLGHSRPAHAPEGGGRIARYALGRDYHNVIGRRLRKFARELRARGWLGEWKKVVDAGPLLERSHAAEAGLGFESKAANLLHPRFGPWFFLGELLVDTEVEPTAPSVGGSCGSCTACLDACPTAAIVAPGTVDARRCLSYHTIENRGSIPHELRTPLGDWLFGCDVCSEVCPWGQSAPDLARRFGLHPALEEGRPWDWLTLSEVDFARVFAGSPIQRAGRDSLARNAALVLGNRPSDEGRAALRSALADPVARVREAAAWGLAKAHGQDEGVRESLARTVESETNPGARVGMLRSLAELG